MNALALSPRQRAILERIDEYWRTRGYAPDFRKLNELLASRSTSVVRYNVLWLEQRGLLHIPREDGDMVSHAMRLTDAGRAQIQSHHGNGTCPQTP